MKSSERHVTEFIRTVGRYRVLHRALWLAVGWLFLWGAAVLVMRYGFQLPQQPMWFGLLGLPVCAAIAWFVEWPRRPTPDSARAYIDQRNDCGGLFMAELDAWRHRLPERISTPDLRWHKRGPLAALVVAALFAGAAILLPQSLVTPLFAQQQLEIDDQVDDLLEHIAELEELDSLSQAEADELKEQLDQLREEADGTDPVSTWSALDQLEDLLEEESAQTATNMTAQLSKEGASAEKIEELAEALENLQERELDNESLSEAMKDLQELMKDKQVEDMISKLTDDEDMKEALEKLAEGLDQEDLKDLAESIGNNPEMMEQLKKLAEGVDPEELKELAEQMKKNAEGMKEQLKQMAQNGMIDPQMLEEGLQEGADGQDGQGKGEGGENGDGKGGGNGGSFGDFLDQELADRDPEATEMREGDGMQPGGGNGGIQRGPGHAPLNFLNNTTKDGAAFKPQVLSPAAIRSLKESKLMGISQAAPGVTEGTAGASGGLDGSAAGAGSANTHRIFPQHRNAVENYFDR